MPSLSEQLLRVLSEILPVQPVVESDGAVTVSHGGTVASLRVVGISDGLDLISLTQVVAWDLKLDTKIRDVVAEQSDGVMLGSVSLVEKPQHSADVLLRYNFPGGGLADDALRTLILMVLDTGADMRRALLG